MRSKLQTLLTFSAAALALGAGTAEAQAFRPVPGTGAGAMPLGTLSAPPSGFIELCERAPEECLSTNEASPEQLAGIRAWAGQSRWTATFAAAGLLTASTASVAMPAASLPPATIRSAASSRTPARRRPTADAQAPAKSGVSSVETRARKDASRKAPTQRNKSERRSKERASALPDLPHVYGSPASATPTGVERPQTPVLSTVADATLQVINRRINRAVRRSSDRDAFGRDDLWVLPTGPRPTGDCEDYVLAKRRALVEAGVSPAAMSIAIVRTHRGEIHAVLLVATADGEQVLDNLSPWVLRWDQAPYEWLERQVPGQALTWVNVASRPATVQIAADDTAGSTPIVDRRRPV